MLVEVPKQLLIDYAKRRDIDIFEASLQLQEQMILGGLIDGGARSSWIQGMLIAATVELVDEMKIMTTVKVDETGLNWPNTRSRE